MTNLNKEEFSLEWVKSQMDKYANLFPAWYTNPLSVNIMEKKYLHSDEKTPEEFVYRVADIFSNNELKKEVTRLLITGSFFPGGRSLYGAGSKGKFNATMSNCMVRGTQVLTTVGFKNIEHVQIGDYVITSQGPQRVNNTMCRIYSGDLYKLGSKQFMHDIICTPNHEFLTQTGWVRADRMQTYANHCVPTKIKIMHHNFQKYYEPIDLLSYYVPDEHDRVALLENNKLVHETFTYNEWKALSSKPVNRYIAMTEEFRYFIGRWLGDGSITRRGKKHDPSILQIVFNATSEKEAADRCIRIGTAAFGIEPSVRYTEQNIIAVRWENPIIGNFFWREFGSKCDGKFLTPKYTGDLMIAIGLLDSDGCLFERGAIGITLKNPLLIYWLQLTLAMNGIRSYQTPSKIHANTVKLHINSASSRKYLLPYMTRDHHNRFDNNYSNESADWAIVQDIQVIQNVTTEVFNLSVDNVHEYNVNGVICHNCYIMSSVNDSLDDIYESNKQIAKIFKSGGGIGINLSKLRPNGAKTNNAARTSTGAVSFMHLYNATGSIIGFHGRRGATLIGLDISHPDIEEFIDLRSKYDMKAMNISCIITDDFMKAVKANKKFKLHFKVEATGENIEKWINARELYHKICIMNWDYGDPGMLFKTAVDTHNFMEFEPSFKIDICNPCAEYTGPAYNSCNLGSMNLYNYVEGAFTSLAHFNYETFDNDVSIAVNALDEILDYGYELQPLDKNREIIDKWRSIGLGYFGFADALIALGIKYGSKESKEFAGKVSKALTSSAIKASSRRALVTKSFGNFHKKNVVKSSLLKELDCVEIVKTNGLRNSQLISIAPTGSLSLLAGSLSSGIEPIFKCQYERSTHGLEDSKVHFTVADRAIMDLMKFHNIEPGSMTTEELKERFPFIVEAADIDPMDRVEVQAEMQKYIDNAISSTVNLPESATVEDIEKIYMKAWELGLKGITVFRDNCKRASILGFSSDKKKEEKKEECQCKCKKKMDSIEPITRKGKGPLSGRTYRKRTACVKALYVTINRDEDGNIFEVFTNKSTHGCSANIATITRMTSLALRSGVKVPTIIQELKENACQACQQLIKAGQHDVSLSCPYAIGEALEEEYKQSNYPNKVEEIKAKVKDIKKLVKEAKENQETEADADTSDSKVFQKFKTLTGKVKGSVKVIHKYSALECPECGERTLIIEGKCTSCKRCGYSKCD